MEKCKLIAEIGCSHLGSLKRAKNLAYLAKVNGADILKTQKRNPHESIKEELKHLPHPNPRFSYGNTYLGHRQALELTIKEHLELKTYCESIEIEYMSSVFDLTSAKEIISLNPKNIKIPSCCNNNYELLNYIYHNFTGKIHISLGMLNKNEKWHLTNYLEDRNNKFIPYHCTSEYPCEYSSLFLKEISYLRTKFNTCGFSNHNKNLITDIRGYTLGRNYIEKHFIDNLDIRHTDTAVSITPTELRNLKENLDLINESLKYKKDITEKENIQKEKLRYY
jgi:sialic acid synthase